MHPGGALTSSMTSGTEIMLGGNQCSQDQTLAPPAGPDPAPGNFKVIRTGGGVLGAYAFPHSSGVSYKIPSHCPKQCLKSMNSTLLTLASAEPQIQEVSHYVRGISLQFLAIQSVTIFGKLGHHYFRFLKRISSKLCHCGN